MSDLERLRAGLAREAQERERQLAAARAEGARRGKEPFSLEALERHLDLSGPLGRTADRALLEDELEREYYLVYPEVLSLEELADKKRENESRA